MNEINFSILTQILSGSCESLHTSPQVVFTSFPKSIDIKVEELYFVNDQSESSIPAMWPQHSSLVGGGSVLVTSSHHPGTFLGSLHWPVALLNTFFRPQLASRGPPEPGHWIKLCQLILSFTRIFSAVDSSAWKSSIRRFVITEKALLGPSPGWKRLLPLSHLRHY